MVRLNLNREEVIFTAHRSERAGDRLTKLSELGTYRMLKPKLVR